MGRRAWMIVLACVAAGCAETVQERARGYNEDGVFLYRRGRYAEAQESFQAALKLQPESADLHYNVGQCHDNLGESAQAEQLYKECLQRAPDHAECRHALAQLLIHEGRQQDAVEMVGSWLGRSRQLAAPYAEDGWLYLQHHEPNSAIGRFQQALDKDANDVRALTGMARAYEDLHYPDRALVLYQRALVVQPHQPEVEERVRVLRKAGVGPPRPDE
jgi:Tfp pilus assembly protein PilF